MERGFDLADIAARTGIGAQRLRYVLDQRLLPGTQSNEWSVGRGRARRFTPFEAFAIVCAALLLEAGIGRIRVTSCMAAFSKSDDPANRNVDGVLLWQAFQARDVAYLEVGDGSHVRVVGSEDYRRKPLDSGWRNLNSGEVALLYQPLITIRIDVARVRRFLAGKEETTCRDIRKLLE